MPTAEIVALVLLIASVIVLAALYVRAGYEIRYLRGRLRIKEEQLQSRDAAAQEGWGVVRRQEGELRKAEIEARFLKTQGDALRSSAEVQSQRIATLTAFDAVFDRKDFVLEVLRDKAKELDALCGTEIQMQQGEAANPERQAKLLTEQAEKIRESQKKFWEAVSLAVSKYGEPMRKKSFRDYL